MKKAMKQNLPIEIIELENNNFHLLLEGRFQDRTIGHWIIDTGASKSVFDKNLTDYYKAIEPGDDEEFHSAGINEGTVETAVGEIKRVKFGKFKLKNLHVALISLDHVNDIYRRYHDVRIVGLLGGDILKKYSAVIDYGKKEIIFSD